MEIPDVSIDAALSDPELCRLMEQRLRLWLREMNCWRRSYRGLQLCNGPDCNFMVKLIEHYKVQCMDESRRKRDKDNCTWSDCKVMKRIIRHWNNCNNYECPICGPTLASRTKPLAEFGSAPAKEWHQHQSLSEAQRQHAIQLLAKFSNVKPSHCGCVRRVVNTEAEKYFEADSLAEYYHLLAEEMGDMEIEAKHDGTEMERRRIERYILHCRCVQMRTQMFGPARIPRQGHTRFVVWI